MLHNISTCVKSYDGQTKWTYFLIEGDDLLEKEFGSEPVSNKRFLKTKLKSHGDEVADFYDKKIPELDSNHTCLEVISLDSVLKKDDNYYQQVFLNSVNTLRKK